uniref:Uncharacterized protein n=1 Tax=Onchocerca volvulus TaxID=6282 RepID=A0A8R1Y4A2_ONCVO
MSVEGFDLQERKYSFAGCHHPISANQPLDERIDSKHSLSSLQLFPLNHAKCFLPTATDNRIQQVINHNIKLNPKLWPSFDEFYASLNMLYLIRQCYGEKTKPPVLPQLIVLKK